MTSSNEFHFSPRPNRAAEIAWRPWGPDAFREARDADRPILLAISAVWCHWCHVMDETSYSDPQVISAINGRYVAIRVDNDQRPDVNRRYNMGGWPTTAFLTPEGEVIHGGTYVPPDAMRSYVAQVADVWRDKREEIAARMRELRDRENERRSAPGELSWQIVDAVGSLVRGQYDPQFGGFGREPKFPQPKLLRFLIDEYRRHAYPDVATMLHRTLAAIAQGGMHDAVEGGFFRYSTTRQWTIPHFEKMLEDNAELLAVYAEAHRTFPQAGYDQVVRDVIRWMDSVLWQAGAKAFAGSQDADEHYYGLDAEERSKHQAPYVDRTIYTGWNALAASVYFAAHAALDDEMLDERAHDVMGTLATRMMPGEPRALMHFDRGDGPQVADLLADFAAFLAATIDAYETGRHPGALAGAVRIATAMCERLEDTAEGGFWDGPAREEPGRVGRREKPIEDGAAAADALLRLAALTGEERWRESAVRALRGCTGEYRQWGQVAAAYAGSVARALAEPLSIVVVGAEGDARTAALWAAAKRSDDPARALHRFVPERDAERMSPLGYAADRSAAYVCVGTVCSAPLGDERALGEELASARQRFERSWASS
ncbi:hypothetical protein BH18CHL2_BH18CHL2_01960 [soil metagenome]